MIMAPAAPPNTRIQATTRQDRHPGISCSDALLLKVFLPDTKLADIELDVRSTHVRVQAPTFKLKVPLRLSHAPHRAVLWPLSPPCQAWLPDKVDESKGTAKWDSDKETLLVTIPILHDDFGTKLSVSSELD